MPGLDSQIFALALIAFLSIGALTLTIEHLIHLVIQIKKLKATLQSDYSIETGKIEPRPKPQRVVNADIPKSSKVSVSVPTELVGPESIATEIEDSNASANHTDVH